MVRGKRYYRYVCGGYNSKRICPSFSIGREQIESFAIESVKAIISDPRMIAEVEKQLSLLIGEGPSADLNRARENAKLIQDADVKIRNLTNAIESGVELASVVKRLKEIEAERQSLIEEDKRRCAPIPRKQLKLPDVKKAVAEFFSDFENRFGQASLTDKRALIRKCIQQIEVDPGTKSATFYVRRVPAINAEIEALYAQADAAAKAGGRLFSNTDVPGTGLEPARPCGH